MTVHELQTPALARRQAALGARTFTCATIREVEGMAAAGLGEDLLLAIDAATVLFCSDEHVTFVPDAPLRPGARLRVWPAHVDPTVAYHTQLHVVDGEQVLDSWPVDLRGW